MNIETFQIFCDLAELLSFSKTSEKHCLSQSAISQQLAQLELSYKCQLVNRKKRPIELTKEGQVLYEAAKDIADRYENLKTKMKLMGSSHVNRINIAAIFSIGMHALPMHVKQFMIRFPDVHVHIEYLSATEIYNLVLSGDIDIGIVAVPKRDKRLEVKDFEEEQLVLACSPKHSFASEIEIDIHRIRFERFIAFSSGLPTRIWIDGILNRYNIVMRPVMEFDNIETIKRAIEINSGISILPANAIKQELKAGTIKGLTFTNENFIRPTGIITRKDKILSQSQQYFIQLLTRAI